MTEQNPQQQPYQQPQYQQQPYQQPQYAPTYAQSTPTNTMALVSLITGIAGLTIFPFIASIIAVITGHMARKQIRQTGEAGDGMALAGLITGWIGVLVGVLFLIFVIIMFVFAATVSTTSY